MSDQVLAEINSGEMKGLTFAAVRNKKHKDIFIKCKNEPTVPAQSYDSNVIEKHAGEGSRGRVRSTLLSALCRTGGLTHNVPSA